MSAPFQVAQDNPRSGSSPRSASRQRLRREFQAHWLGPLCVAFALALLSVLGVFSQLDGRFFDTISVNQAGTKPSVVVIVRDPSFEQQGNNRFGYLNEKLGSLGAERIGYLGDDLTGIPAASRASEVPVILGLPAKPLKAHQMWTLEASEADFAGSVPAARTLAPSQYGIHRAQTAQLAGRSGPIPVFDAALAGQAPARREFLVPMPRRQSIPILNASQIAAGEIGGEEIGAGSIGSGALTGTAAMVVTPETLQGRLSTPLNPGEQTTSEAIFRAHAVHALRSGGYGYPAQDWEVWVLLLALGGILALLMRETDPKRLAIIVPLSFSVLIIAASWGVLVTAGKLLPVTALLLATWLITFQRIIERETFQDRALDRVASRAVQLSLNRSALREGARLPQYLGSAAALAGVERSMLIQVSPGGELTVLAASNAAIDDIQIDTKRLSDILGKVRRSQSVDEAGEIVPGWQGEVRIGWVGAGEEHLYWIYTRPVTATPGRSAHLVRAITASFRELFRWRVDLNARGSKQQRNQPIDERVASAIALVANESEQIRRGFDAIGTAVVIFHLIGSPLHANEAMQEIYEEAGLDLYETSLTDALLALTHLGPNRVRALIEGLMLNGSEMLLPMRNLGDSERTSEHLLRVAATQRREATSDRVLVLEAIDVREANRAADLRKAVGKYIDLQLRNDFEAILLGSELASDTRLGPPEVQQVIAQINETALRATERLNKVGQLVRSETIDVTEACYPVDAAKVVKDAVAQASALAKELGVEVNTELPGVSGFTMAEPVALTEMLCAMLRVIIADTPNGGTVAVSLEEVGGRTHIRISGGFGIGFDRLLWLISSYEEGAVGEFRVIGEGMAKVTRWLASISYWGSEANGFGFNIDLQGIG
jgi:hypothetical protein